MLPPPPSVLPFDVNGSPNEKWIDWMDQNYRTSRSYLGSFTTAGRPTNLLRTGDWGFDTTLGKPIWYKGPGWVDATGAAA
jgi:hypothetical protein